MFIDKMLTCDRLKKYGLQMAEDGANMSRA